MKKIRISFFIVCILSVFSCNKILNTTPQDFVTPTQYYKTERDLESALAGIYDRLGDVRVYAQAMTSYLVFSDEFFMKGRTSGILANIIDASTLEINRHWESLYTGIERANMLLDNIDNAEVSTEKYNEVKGQALFMRGYYYFMLVDEFGEVPLKLASSKSPEDPYLTSSPIKEIYEQIVKDMKEAEDLVKSVSDYGYNTRITKTTVQGILARVYLTMAGSPLNDVDKYADAMLYAQKVIESKQHALNPDFKQIFINHSQELFDTKECLWEVEFRGTNQGEIQEGGMIGSYNGIVCSDIDTGWAYDYVHATLKLYEAYQNGDLRRDWTIAPFRFVTENDKLIRKPWADTQIYERSPGKWRREYEKTLPRTQFYTGTNWPLLRYSDVLLMYAEADNYVNDGPSEQAYDAINKVRRRGYGKDINNEDATVDVAEDLSQQDFRDSIKNERLREFAFEGLRKHDLVRWGIYVSTMEDQAAKYQAEMPNDLKGPAVSQAQRVTGRSVVFPIPNSERATNPNVEQNEGW